MIVTTDPEVTRKVFSYNDPDTLLMGVRRLLPCPLLFSVWPSHVADYLHIYLILVKACTTGFFKESCYPIKLFGALDCKNSLGC